MNYMLLTPYHGVKHEIGTRSIAVSAGKAGKFDRVSRTSDDAGPTRTADWTMDKPRNLNIIFRLTIISRFQGPGRRRLDLLCQ